MHKDENETLLGVDEETVVENITERDKVLKTHFELQITQEALKGHKTGDYIKASMLSWSYIEEFYLPVFIKYIGTYHKLPIGDRMIEKASVNTLIQYYYLISHDKDLYDKLEIARKLRNILVHNLYKSSSIQKINDLAKRSSQFNIDLIMNDLWEREEGKVPIPSMLIAINARNELRKEQRKRLKELMGKPQ